MGENSVFATAEATDFAILQVNDCPIGWALMVQRRNGSSVSVGISNSVTISKFTLSLLPRNSLRSDYGDCFRGERIVRHFDALSNRGLHAKSAITIKAAPNFLWKWAEPQGPFSVFNMYS